MKNLCMGCHAEIRDGDWCSLCRVLGADVEYKRIEREMEAKWKKDTEARKQRGELPKPDDDMPF